MATITINSSDYEAHADVATADEFLAGDFGATDWRAEEDEDAKGRALVTATRMLNNVLCVDGVKLGEVDEADIPEAIIHGSIVLAKLIHAGSTVASSSTTASNIKRQQAGSVSIEYFSPLLLTNPSRWPVEVLDHIRSYFCGSGVGGVIASGVDGCSAFNPGYDIGAPF